jgi:2-methylcitrate dehydratase PrpD
METHHSTHSISSDFGAAAAAGCAASLDAAQMCWLLDYAAQQASGTAAWKRDTDHIEKSLVFAGMPARNGVTAALLVQLGGTGVDDIFSGSDNFFAAFGPRANPEGLVDQLGKRYEIAITNIKKWTVGSPIQAPLDALEILMKTHPFTADQVAQAVVRVAADEAVTVDNREMPDICLQHMVAVMLLDRTASFAAAHDKPRMQDAAILRTRAKVQLVHDAELQKLYPKRIAVVELTLADGTKLAERVDAVRGTSDNPMTHEEIAAKARDLMTPRLGGAKTARLIEAIWNLEKLTDIRNLRPLLQTG